MRLEADFVGRVESVVADKTDLDGLLISNVMQHFGVPPNSWRKWLRIGALHAASESKRESPHARLFRVSQQLGDRAWKKGYGLCVTAAKDEGPSGTRAKMAFGTLLMRKGDPIGWDTSRVDISGEVEVSDDASQIPESAIHSLTDADITRLEELRDAREAIDSETRQIVEAAMTRAQVAASPKA